MKYKISASSSLGALNIGCIHLLSPTSSTALNSYSQLNHLAYSDFDSPHSFSRTDCNNGTSSLEICHFDSDVEQMLEHVWAWTWMQHIHTTMVIAASRDSLIPELMRI